MRSTHPNIPQNMKWCYFCGQIKNKSEFTKCINRADGLQSRCRACRMTDYQTKKEQLFKKRREYYINNADKIKKASITSYYKNREAIRLRRTCLKFNITKEQYLQFLEKQNYSCLICGTHQDKLRKKLAIDHNHKTGKIRGLLCATCNSAIGLLKDNADIIKNAYLYLKDNV